MSYIKKTLSCAAILCIILLLFSACGKTDQSEQPSEPGIFAHDDEMRLVFESFTAKEQVKTETYLTKEEGDGFIELIKPYENDLTDDVLKSEFTDSYTVKLSDTTTVQIDARCDYKGREGQTYMFVIRRSSGYTKLYGAFIDASAAYYLAGIMD